MFNNLKANVIFLAIDILASASNLITWLLYQTHICLVFAIVSLVNMVLIIFLIFWEMHLIKTRIETAIKDRENEARKYLRDNCVKDHEIEELKSLLKEYQQPASAHIVKNQRSHGKTLELIKAVEQETLKRFTEYIKGKLSAIYKERVSEKSDGDFKLGASLLLVAQGEIEKAKGEFLNGENKRDTNFIISDNEQS